jgi:hypothetical protein
VMKGGTESLDETVLAAGDRPESVRGGVGHYDRFEIIIRESNARENE